MPDKWIIEMAAKFKMIEPFEKSLVGNCLISYGVSSYGYDFRVSREFKIADGAGEAGEFDPKNPSPETFADFAGDICLIPPRGFVIARSLEYFRIPRDVLAICLGKSTYTRNGLLINFAPFEPEWEGHVTFGVFNSLPLPVRLYAGEGIAQVLFLKADSVCETSYSDRKGKYQSSKGISLSRVMRENEQNRSGK